MHGACIHVGSHVVEITVLVMDGSSNTENFPDRMLRPGRLGTGQSMDYGILSIYMHSSLKRLPRST